MLRDGCLVLGVAADVQDAAVDLGVQGLHPAVEHLGEAGEVGDIAHGQAGVAQGLGRTSCRHEVHAMGGERLGEADEAGLVGDGEQGAADLFERGGLCGQLGLRGDGDVLILCERRVVHKRWPNLP